MRGTLSKSFCEQRTAAAQASEARATSARRAPKLPRSADRERREAQEGCGSRQDGARGARLRAHHRARQRSDGGGAAPSCANDWRARSCREGEEHGGRLVSAAPMWADTSRAERSLAAAAEEESGRGARAPHGEQRTPCEFSCQKRVLNTRARTNRASWQVLATTGELSNTLSRPRTARYLRYV